MSIIQTLNLWTFLPLIIWAFFSIIWAVRKSTNRLYLQSIPSGFTMAGVLGTFIGIAIGLNGFDVLDVSGSIPTLLEGLKNSFYTSITGIILAMVTAKVIEKKLLQDDKIVDSTETFELKRLADLMQKQIDTNNQNVEKIINAFSSSHLVNILNRIENATSQSADKLALIPDQITSCNVHLVKVQNSQNSHFQQIIEGNTASIMWLEKNNQALSQLPIVINKHQTKETNRLITTLDNNNQELSQKIAEMNSKELLKAMEESVELFNKKMEDIMQKLIKKNFEALNNSVKQMNDWQVQNMENMEALIKEQKNLIVKNSEVSQQFESTSEVVHSNFQRTSTEINDIVVNTKKLTDDNSRLQKILEELESVALGDNQFKTIITQAEDSIKNVNEATEKFSTEMNKVDELVEGAEKLNGNIYKTQENLVVISKELQELAKLKDMNDNYWKDVKKKMNEGIGILNNGSERLSDDLDNIDDQFRSRLQQTFESLDRLMRGYLTNN